MMVGLLLVLNSFCRVSSLVTDAAFRTSAAPFAHVWNLTDNSRYEEIYTVKMNQYATIIGASIAGSALVSRALRS